LRFVKLISDGQSLFGVESLNMNLSGTEKIDGQI